MNYSIEIGKIVEGALKHDQLKVINYTKQLIVKLEVKCTPCQVQNLLSGSSSATSCDILPSLCR